MSAAAELLADCDAHGIRLSLAGDDGLTIDGPQDALTTNLMTRLKACKAELLTLLRPVADVVTPAQHVVKSEVPARPTKLACRCGSITWRDVPIHAGQSRRRDCRRCGRFINFPVWYGKSTLHNEQ